MSFVFSKILTFLLFPINWIMLLMILSFIIKKSTVKKVLRYTALGLFVFFSNPFIFSEVLLWWEGELKNPPTEHYDVVIVLGGYSSWNEHRKVISFNESSDRLLQALRLYQMGQTDKILLTGGSGLILKPEEKESEFSKDILKQLQVDAQDILLEPNSRNTYENAQFSAELLRDLYGSNGRFLLITSAFHMRRAQACFEKTGLTFDTFSVDYQIDPNDYTPTTYILPSAFALDLWQTLLREWVGMGYYRLRGFL